MRKLKKPRPIGALAAIGAAWLAASPLAYAGQSSQSKASYEGDFAAEHDKAAAAYLNGELDRALAGFNSAIAINPSSSLAYYNRGNVHYAKGDFAAAIVDFTEALRLNPVQPYAHMNRGNALSNLGRFNEALRDLDEAVRLQPEVSDTYFNRAIVHVRRREVDKALADYETAIGRDGEDQEAAAARQRLLELLGETKAEDIASIDTARITTEIAHARQVEHLLQLLTSTCIKHGDNLAGLKTLAMLGNWKAAPNVDLTHKSTESTGLDGGWTFTDRFGAYALVHSVSSHKPPVYVCSLTTKPISPHLFNDLRLGFESRFKVSARDRPARPGQQVIRYRLSNEKGSVLTALAFASKYGALTLRTYLGNP